MNPPEKIFIDFDRNIRSWNTERKLENEVEYHLAQWHDAKTDPPKEETVYELTRYIGAGVWDTFHGWLKNGKWITTMGHNKHPDYYREYNPTLPEQPKETRNEPDIYEDVQKLIKTGWDLYDELHKHEEWDEFEYFACILATMQNKYPKKFTPLPELPKESEN